MEIYNHKKYDEFINNIISSRGLWSENVRFSDRTCERHHIIPKAYGGLPEVLDWSHHENIIWLYPSEHFIAHKLLAEENPDNYIFNYAVLRMAYSKHLDFELTEKDYEFVKICNNLANKYRWQYKSEVEKQAFSKKCSDSHKNMLDDAKQNSIIKRKNTLELNPEITINSQIKRKQTLENKSIEEKEKSKLKLINTIKSRTEEQLKQISEKISAGWHNKPQCEKDLAIKKRLITKANYTDAKKLELHKKLATNLNKKKYSNGIETHMYIVGNEPAGYYEVVAQKKIEKEEYKIKHEHENRCRGQLKRKLTLANKSPEEKLLEHDRRSQATSGKNNGRAKAVICITTGEKFNCKKEVFDKYGIERHKLSKLIKENLPDCNGNTWKEL